MCARRRLSRDIVVAESHASVTKYRDRAGLVLFKYLQPNKEFAGNILVRDDLFFAKARINFCEEEHFCQDAIRISEHDEYAIIDRAGENKMFDVESKINFQEKKKLGGKKLRLQSSVCFC